MAENFSNQVKRHKLTIQEAQKTPGRIKSEKSMLKHIIIKLLKIKEKENFLNQLEENRYISYRRTRIPRQWISQQK